MKILKTLNINHHIITIEIIKNLLNFMKQKKLNMTQLIDYRTGVIIGISGKIGVGKDSVADYLIKRMSNIDFTKESFALNLKEIVSIMCGTSLSTQLTQEGKNQVCPTFGKTYGQLQQDIGGTVLRGYDEDFWLKSLFAKYQNGQNWIISDVRYPNEAAFIRKAGGILIRLNGDPAGIRKNSTRNMSHSSETALDNWDDWDIEFENTPPISNLSKLVSQVDKFVQQRKPAYKPDFLMKAIVAIDENNGIGKNNNLLARLPNDMKHFVSLTKGHTVIMGRKTHESIGFPLTERVNIVITRDKKFKADGCVVVHSIKEAIAEARKYPVDCYVMGGAEIYNQMLPYCNEIEATFIHDTFEADVFFPELNILNWRQIGNTLQETDARNKHQHSFQTYERIHSDF